MDDVGIINGKNVWPWNEVSDTFNSDSNKSLPKISVIVPSYNQGAFLEETLRSIIFQNYPNLELIVIDGGSSDNSVEIIEKYSSNITYWVSEKDRGQSDGINKGFNKATGDWIAWMNSDDCYLKNGLHYLIHNVDLNRYDFLYGNCFIGETLDNCKEIKARKNNNLTVPKLLKFFYSLDYIVPSQSVFVRRGFLKDIGFLDENAHYCMDMEWYVRILQKKPRIFKYEKSICFFRVGSNTKTVSQNKKMSEEAIQIANKYVGGLSLWEKVGLLRLIKYQKVFAEDYLRHLNTNIFNLLKIFFTYPDISLKDKRFLGILKRKFS